MVVKITHASRTIERPLEYNTEKVDRDVASILASFNTDGPSQEEIESTFLRYERRSIRTMNLSFHMNIDPLEGQDNLSDSEIAEFTRRMMEGLGYGEQPYVIYKHSDIDRTHYHVVSIRTRLDGRKISDSFEARRCHQLLVDLSREFDYKVGNISGKRRASGIEKFDPPAGDIIEQMKVIYDKSLEYHFTSFEQFRVILRSYGVRLDARSEGSTHFLLHGLGENGKACTNAVSGRMMESDLFERYHERAEQSVGEMKVMSMERNRIRRCVRGPLADAVSQGHFLNMLAKCGISVSIERDPKTHTISDVNFVDHVTKTAFNISGMGPDLTLEMFREADESRWDHDSRDNGMDLTIGDLLAALAAKGSRSREKDLCDDPRRRRGRKLKF